MFNGTNGPTLLFPFVKVISFLDVLQLEVEEWSQIFEPDIWVVRKLILRQTQSAFKLCVTDLKTRKNWSVFTPNSLQDIICHIQNLYYTGAIYRSYESRRHKTLDKIKIKTHTGIELLLPDEHPAQGSRLKIFKTTELFAGTCNLPKIKKQASPGELNIRVLQQCNSTVI